MASAKTRNPRNLKSEPIVIVRGGIPTPNSPMSTGIVTPKQEEIETSFSDTSEGVGGSFRSHHGFPGQYLDQDEGYHTQVPERKLRSDAPSFTTSRQPSRRRESIDLTVMDQLTGLEMVGEKAKKLVDAFSDLQKFGLDHVARLPELVLVGDQSSGKSSLMSALTEVQLPRDQGICTKCPSNIKTSPAPLWSCKISLMQYYKYVNPQGKPIDSKSVTKKNPFPPWVEQTLEVKNFMTIYDKSELEVAMKWAQIALLNHDQDHEEFIPGSGSRAYAANFDRERANTDAGFSPNVIAVEISGPNLLALSFYDLPGIFNLAPDPKDQYLAQVIRNLATKHIQRPNAVIIWALAMKTDPSNSSTGKVILDCKAEKRTIGVLTNPDHIQVRHLEFENILRGTAHVVGHGFFVTKQPGERFTLCGPDYHAQAREEEMEYFRTDDLWTRDWNEFISRCGIVAIREYVSQVFAEEIAKSIPGITSKIKARTAEVDAALCGLPELPDNDILGEVQTGLVQLSVDVQRLMVGEDVSDFINLKDSWAGLADQFRNLILHITPEIILSHPSDDEIPHSMDPALPSIDLTLDDDDEPEIERPRKHGPPSTPQNPPKRAKVDDTPVATALSAKSSNGSTTTPSNVRSVKRELSRFQSPVSVSNARPMAVPVSRTLIAKPDPFVNTPFRTCSNLNTKSWTLDGIRSEIPTKTRPGLVGLVNDKVYDGMCLYSVQVWDSPLNIFINETSCMLRNALVAVLDKNLGKYRQTRLYEYAHGHLNEFLDKYVAEQQISLNELLDLERYKTFTINRTSMDEYRDKELQALKAIRRKIRAYGYVRKQQRMGLVKKADENLPLQEKKAFQAKKVDAVLKDDGILGKDPCEIELEVAAYVRAYYITAGNRFADAASMNIHGNLFRKIGNNIMFYLENKLGLKGPGAEDTCQSLMHEENSVGLRRKELRLEKANLTGFSARLEELEQETNAAAIQSSIPRTGIVTSIAGVILDGPGSVSQDGDSPSI